MFRTAVRLTRQLHRTGRLSVFLKGSVFPSFWRDRKAARPVPLVSLVGLLLMLWPRLALMTLLSLAYPVTGFAFLLRSRDERGRMLHSLSEFRMVSYNR